MADSNTPNHNFILPEVGGSKQTWGEKLNSNFTALDSLLNTGAGGTFLPRVGGIMTGNITLPDQGALNFQGGGGLSDDATGNIGISGADPSTNYAYYGGSGGPDAAPGPSAILSRKMGDNRYIVAPGSYSSSAPVAGRLNIFSAGNNGIIARFYSSNSDGSSSTVAATISSDGTVDADSRFVCGDTDTTVASNQGTLMNSNGVVAKVSASADPFGPVYRVYHGTEQTFRVNANGNVGNLNNVYGALSDARLKEGVTSASSQLDDVLAMRVVNYNLIGSGEKQIGLIAQELQKVKSGLVFADEDGMLGIKYSVLVPVLVKAVQELNAKVEALSSATGL